MEIDHRSETIGDVRPLEERSGFIEPLRLSARRTFRRPELRQDELLVGVAPGEVHKGLNEILEAGPNLASNTAALVPVVRVRTEEVDGGITRVPVSSETTIGLRYFKSETRERPNPFDAGTFLFKDPVHGVPCVLEVVGITPWESRTRLGLVMEGEPDVAVELTDRPS